MKKIIIILFCLIQSAFLSAQTQYQDVVYLKNGSIIKGMIVEEVPNKTYTVNTTDGSVIVVNISDIAKLRKEPKEGSPEEKTVKKENTGNSMILDKGYETNIEAGYGAKTGRYGLDVAKLAFAGMYRFNKNLSAGAGLGMRYYTWENGGNSTLLPLFLNGRYRFTDKSIAPYISMAAGFSWDASNSFDDAGFLYNPTIGVEINKNKDFMFHIGLGYEMQQMKFLEIRGTSLNPIIRISEAASINIGVTF